MELNQCINQSRLVESFLTLGKIDGVAGKERDVAQYLLGQLARFGGTASMDNAGETFGGNSGNLICRFPGKADTPSIFLCAHMDTVQPTKDIVHVLNNGTIATDGTTILGGDDRAGIAIILEILEVLHEKDIQHGPLEIVFCVCEEAGMYGAKNIQRKDLISEYGFVFDCQASPGKYIIEAPGAISFKIDVFGLPAHAAVSPEKGIHAIQIASAAIAKLKLGRWDQTGMMNIGTIHGGTSINVVPDHVEVTGETRNADNAKLQKQIEYVRAAFETTAEEMGGRVEIRLKEKYGGYQFTGDEAAIQAARQGILAAGLEPEAIRYPGGSDANVFNNNGIQAVNFGVGFKNAHSYQEYIAISDLTTAAQIGLHTVVYCASAANKETARK